MNKIDTETLFKILEKVADQYPSIDAINVVSRHIRMKKLFLIEIDGELHWGEES